MANPSTPIAIQIGATHRASRAVLDGLLGPARISFEEWIVLRALGLDDEGVLPTADLVEYPGVDDSIIDGLTARGLTERRSGASVVALTAAGRSRAESLIAEVSSASARVVDGIDPDDLAIAGRVLRQMEQQAESLVAT